MVFIIAFNFFDIPIFIFQAYLILSLNNYYFTEGTRESMREKIVHENKVYNFFLTTQTRCIAEQKVLTLFLIYLVVLRVLWP